ncbi:retron St85 family effector protein [Pseudoxanthomonas daejeonensis]|uniref:retron St85 family effector protein n=1 Tax=Pseudoxanthomonas daejeonensis TaxID=266062 RepID=UPI001F54394C|nr:retron St85 family effector protein [Pseudoxanthomonas daejeonensis]UNK56181.1 retron St85 family effector protein [Pseudoxanthomonas daejeonensis]
MQVIKENKAFDPPRSRIVSFFRRGDLHFRTDIHLCFVCGAADPLKGEPPKWRRQFLDWVAVNEGKIICVKAENAVTDLLREVDERRTSKDLSIIEETIADTVDSLLLFPESPGSFAELGLFSANDAIGRKMLVAVEHQYQGDSFIILGPVKRINAISSFTPLPIVISEPEASFAQIRTRLLKEEQRGKSYAKRYSHGDWKAYSPREQLAIIDKIIDLTGILTEDDLFDLINKIFGKYEKSDIRLLVALLTTLGRAERTDMGDIVRILKNSKMPFIDGGGEEAAEVKAAWADTYRGHVPDAQREVEERNLELL